MDIKKILRSGLAILCSVSMMLGCLGMIAPIVKASDSLPTGFYPVTPQDLGIPDTTNESGGVTLQTPEDDVVSYNIDKTILCADVKFTTNQNSHMTYLYSVGGRGQLQVLLSAGSSSLLVYNYRLSGDTNLYIGGQFADGEYVKGDYDPVATNGIFYIKWKNTSVGNSFHVKDFTLWISTELVDFDGDGSADDLQIGFWINGELYENTYWYYVNYQDTTFQGRMTTSNMTKIQSPVVQKPGEPNVPVEYTTVTPAGFGIASYENNSGTTYTNTATPFTSADKIRLEADVVFGRGDINYLYNETYQGGISLRGRENLQFWNLLSASDGAGIYVGGSYENGEYVNGEFISGRYNPYIIRASKLSSTQNFDTLAVKLAITTEFVDFDKDGSADDLKVGIWFDGNLYDETYLYLRNCLDVYTPYLNMSVTKMTTAGELPPVNPPVNPDNPPELTPPTFEEITFSDFIEDGTYGYNGVDFAAVGEHKDGFANKTFVGTVNFNEYVSTSIIFGGKASAWEGAYLASSGTTGLRFYAPYNRFESVTIDGDWRNQNVDVKLSVEVVDADEDGETDDVRFWLYLEDVLYKNGPIVEAIDYVEYLGNYLAIYSDNEAAQVTVTSKELNRPVVTPPTFEEITFSDFIEDGTYSHNGVDLATSGSYKEGFANKTFVGTVNFSSKASTAINFAATDIGWQGVHLVTYGESGFTFMEPYGRFKSVSISGDWRNRDVDIKLSFEVADLDDDGETDDVRFWLYLNNELYKGKPIVEAIDYAQYLGKNLGIYSDNTDSNVTVTSKELNRPIPTPPEFPEITFSDFMIEDEEYGYNGVDLAASGSYKEGFANKTFVGTVNFSSKGGSSIHFAGVKSGWEGVRLTNEGTSGLVFSAAYGRFKAVSIQGDWRDKNVEFKLSFEVTDLDEDGQEDDVRFWLVLDGALYRNQPIVEAIDYAQYLGNFFGIYSDNEESKVTIVSKELYRPVVEVDFAMMGFTKDWAKTLAGGAKAKMQGVGASGSQAPNTGDDSMITNYVVICIVSFVVFGGVLLSGTIGEKEKNL